MSDAIRGQRTGLAQIIYGFGFEGESTKFKKISKRHGVRVYTSCMYGYEIEDDIGKLKKNICPVVQVSLVYKILSIGKRVRLPYIKVGIENVISAEDAGGSSEPHCNTCPKYIKNVAEDFKKKTLVKYLRK